MKRFFFIIGLVNIIAFGSIYFPDAEAQEDVPAKPAAKPKAEIAAKPPRMEAIMIKLPDGQMVCQPRAVPVQCLPCTSADPCYLYRQAQQPVRE